MMKKISRSLLILLLACLLALSACSKAAVEAPADSDPVQTTQTGVESESEAEEPIPQNEVVDYQAILGEWSEYLEYRAPEQKLPSVTELFTLPEGEGYREMEGGFAQIKTSRVENEQTVYTTAVYNLKNGTRIVSDLESAEGEHDPRYTIRYSGAYVEVESAVWSEESGYTSTYRYYDAFGRTLRENAESTSIWSFYEKDGCVFTTIGTTCYLSRDGQPIHAFEAGKERVLPVVDFSYSNYHYVREDSEITILDQEFGEVLSYPISTAYDVTDLFVLSNGSLLLTRASACEEGSDGAVEDRFGNAVMLSYLLMDPVAGTVKELEPTFALAERGMITRFEDGGSCLTPRGEYQYAEIYPIVGGVMAANAIPVILDDQLNVVTELPLILKNQATLVRAINENQLMIRTKRVNGSENGRFYSVNLVTCKTQLYPDLASDVYRAVDGGFLFGNTLYNAAMTEKTELAEGSYTLHGGRIFETVDGVHNMISVTGGQFLRHSLATGEVTYREDLGLFEVWVIESGERILYNGQGELLAKGTVISMIRDFEGALVIRCDGPLGSVYYTVR